MAANGADSETPTCGHCGSNIRTRGLIRAFTLELFGARVAVPVLPRLKSLRGLGISDSEIYARSFEEKFNYQNTYLHREPRFDITSVPESESGQYDFIVCSEVLEHVAPPVEQAFANLYRLLRPNGALIFSVPYSLKETTREHFPELHQFAVARLGDRHVLVNRTRNGETQVFDDLVFHGGAGSVLELRLFTESDLKRHLTAAGFSEIHIHSEEDPALGVTHDSPCSLPITARKGSGGLKPEAAGELLEQWSGFMRSKWIRLGVKLGLVR